MTANERPFKERVHGTDAILKGKVDFTEGVDIELKEPCGNTATSH
jgi:hypothetical protein